MSEDTHNPTGSIRIDRGLHTTIKVAAAARNMTLKEVADAALNDWLKRNGLNKAYETTSRHSD